jgi:hypothetical protein
MSKQEQFWISQRNLRLRKYKPKSIAFNMMKKKKQGAVWRANIVPTVKVWGIRA